MHGHRPGEFCPRLGKELGPFPGIEFLRRELRHHVLVADRVLVAELPLMIAERGAVRVIHAVPVPLPAGRTFLRADGHRAPVRVDAELGVAKPLRILVRLQRFPGGLEWALGHRLAHALQLLLQRGFGRAVGENSRHDANDQNRGPQQMRLFHKISGGWYVVK